MDSMESRAAKERRALTGPYVIAALTTEGSENEDSNGLFGVDALQSSFSGLPQYTAAAGFRSVNLELSVLHIIYNSWTVQGLAGYNTLIGDTNNSPIVKDDDHIYFAGIINHHF